MTAARETEECPYCYTDIDARASFCPNCSKSIKVKTFGYGLGSILMIIGLLAVFDAFIFERPGDVETDLVVVVIGAIILLVGWVIRIIA